MKKLLVRLSLATLCMFAASQYASAQTMVHAMAGTVSSVMPQLRMIEVTTEDGSAHNFQWSRNDPKVHFDKNVSEDATSNNAATQGDHVIVYYFGDGDPRTAMAVRSLGNGAPVKETYGAVEKLDRHNHVLTIKSATGTEITYQLDPKTVGDTNNGVAENFKFDFDKGSAVRVTATDNNGTATAWLIVPAM